VRHFAAGDRDWLPPSALKQLVNSFVVLWNRSPEMFSIQALAKAATQVLAAVCESPSAYQELRAEILELIGCLATCGDAK
jgi:hypothetical protein